jgi:hypothetical protein
MKLLNLKNTVGLLAFVFAVSSPAASAWAADTSPQPSPTVPAPAPVEAVTDFRSTMKLSRQGTLDVQEQFLYDFGSTKPHSVSRRILTGFTDDQGNLLQSKFVLVDAKNGKKLLDIHPDINGSIATINLPPGSDNKPQQYSLHYQLSPVILAGADADIFKFSATGLGWSVPINQAAVTLLASGNSPEGLTCYTGASGSTTSSCRITEHNSLAQIVTDAVLQPGEALSIHSGFPKHSFSKYYNSWSFASLLIPLAIVIALAVLAMIFLHRRRQRSRHHTELE